MAIGWRQNGAGRRSIIEDITEIQLKNDERKWFLFNKNGVGIRLEDCPTQPDDIVYLNTDGSGFPEEEIL